MVEAMSTAAQGMAMVLAIGTATPPGCIYQSDYPEYYCRLTNSEHIPELKNNLKRICDGTMIRKRYFHLTEEMLKSQPSMATHKEPSLDTRQDILLDVVPMLGKEAATKALDEWGQPKSSITHLVFSTTTGGLNMPGPDYQLVNLLELDPSVKRHMIYLQGCYAGGTALRVAKDLAENNLGARVLVVCSESTVATFRGPFDADMENLIVMSLFGDAASAIIVGSNPDLSVERPLYEIISTNQTFLPGTENEICCRVTESGITIHLSPSVPKHISMNIKKCLVDAFTPLGVTDWNSLFWIVHPGGKRILNEIENELKLTKEKLQVSRHVLAEYGNTIGSIVFFVMDEMRKQSVKERKTTTGEGLEFGVLFGFGPGLTIETIVLRAIANPVVN